jgi:membrane associated rhomboid family serine protease
LIRRRPSRASSSDNDPSATTTSSLDALDSLLSSVDGGENDDANNPNQPRRVPVAKQDAAPRTSFLNPGRQTGRFINEAVLRSDVTAGRATLLGEPVDLPRSWPPVVTLSLAAAQLLTMMVGVSGGGEVDSFAVSTVPPVFSNSPLDLIFAAHASSNDALAAVLLLALLGTEAEAVYGSWRALAIYAASTGAGVATALLAIAATSLSATPTTTTCCVASAGAVGLAAAAAASARANGSLPWLNLLTDRFVGAGASDSPTASKVRWGAFFAVVIAAVALEVESIGAGSTATLSAASLSGYALGSFLCPRWQLQRDVQLEDGAMSLPAEATLLLSSKANGASAAAPPTSQQNTARDKLRTVVVAVDRRGDLERSVALVGAALAVSLALKIGMAVAGV